MSFSSILVREIRKAKREADRKKQQEAKHQTKEETELETLTGLVSKLEKACDNKEIIDSMKKRIRELQNQK